MRGCLILGLAIALLSDVRTVAAVEPPMTPLQQQAASTMPAFRNDGELRAFLNRALDNSPPPPPAPPPMAAPPGLPIIASPGVDGADAQEIVVTGSRIANPSITNTQIAGVDEGGIVKVAGSNLVILRRGRLFTVSTAGDTLRAIDAIDAYPPGVDASDDWYDEMLISGDLIVVVGFSYGRGGTELNRFRVSPEGRLTFVDSHHLKSDDYYSDRNYASRLIGNQLVVYSPLSLNYDEDPLEALPGLSRWTPGQAEDGEPNWRRIVSAREVYIPRPMRDAEAPSVQALHTVTRCDLSAPVLDCEATVVLGDDGRTFFVSQNAVYVWIDRPWSANDDDPSWLYRIPLDGGRPGAVQVWGAPVDQFSFRPDAGNGKLDILVTREGGGDAMWNQGWNLGQPALLSLPTTRFGDGSTVSPPSDYRALPGDGRWRVERNRFVGDTLLYVMYGGNGTELHAVPLTGGDPARFDVKADIGRIEPVGRDALVVATDEKSTFLTVDLTPGRTPSISDRYVQPGSGEAEGRSHAFFYRADPGSPQGRDGVLGLPMTRRIDARVVPPHGATVTDMQFLQRANGRLGEFGRLRTAMKDDPDLIDDGCVASCVDWYGGARPIFLGDRVFALLGYELVEGEATDRAIRERRRLDFTPPEPDAEVD